MALWIIYLLAVTGVLGSNVASKGSLMNLPKASPPNTATAPTATCYPQPSDNFDTCHYGFMDRTNGHYVYDEDCGKCLGSYNPYYTDNTCSHCACVAEPAICTPGDYIFVNVEMSWSDANEYCASNYGTSLATIKDMKDGQEILDLTYKTDEYRVIGMYTSWIGLNKHSGEWQWASGYPCDDGNCSSLAYWKQGFPGYWTGSCAVSVHTNVTWGTDFRDNTKPDNMLQRDDCSWDKPFVCDKYPVSVSAASGRQIPAFMDGNNMNMDAEEMEFTLILSAKDLVIAVLSVTAVICMVITCLVNGNSGSAVYRK